MSSDVKENQPSNPTPIKENTQSRLVSRAGLVVFPTSLCSSQIAGIIAKSVEATERGESNEYNTHLSEEEKKTDIAGVYSFTSALIHTEGCAEGYGPSALDGMKNYDRVTIGHLLHPFTRSAFLVEHGCEKSLLSYFEQHLEKDYGVSMDRFGQGSVQKEGGIENTVVHVAVLVTLHS